MATSNETATYIGDLPASPTIPSDSSTGGRSRGGAEIRKAKQIMRATFPNTTGAVTPTHTELNFVDGVTSAIQTQLDGKSATGHTHASTDLTDTADLTYNADTDVSGNAWVLDEDTLSSDSNTKVPTQQSVKAYADTALALKAPLASPNFTGTPQKAGVDLATTDDLASAGGAWTQITAPTSIAEAATLEITWDETTYSMIRIVIEDAAPAANNVELRGTLGYNNGASFIASYRGDGFKGATAIAATATATYMSFMEFVGSTAGRGFSAIFDITCDNSTKGGAAVAAMGACVNSSGAPEGGASNWVSRTSSVAVDTFKLYTALGNLAASGTYSVYGLKRTV